jgi:hypothetical protein
MNMSELKMYMKKRVLIVIFITFVVSFAFFAHLTSLDFDEFLLGFLVIVLLYLLGVLWLLVRSRGSVTGQNGDCYALIKDNKKVVNKTSLLEDYEKRQFLKFVGSLGLSAFLLFFLNKKTKAVRFGETGGEEVGGDSLSGEQTTGSVTLTDADTWYQVPATNQEERVFLALNNRSGQAMYWSFSGEVSSTEGGMLFPSGGNLMLDVSSTVNVFVRCPVTGQQVWYVESQ